MKGYSKAAREAFNAEREKQAKAWEEKVNDSFTSPFSWTASAVNNKFRRNFSTNK